MFEKEYHAYDVDYILETSISEEAFLRRGFILSQQGRATKGLIPENDGKEIESNNRKRFYAQNFRDEYMWIKGLSGRHPNKLLDEYPLLLFTTTKVGNNYVVDGFAVFKQNILNQVDVPFGFPRQAFFQMEYIPEDAYKEFGFLSAKRFTPNNFSLIGKPLPKDKSKFEETLVIKLSSAWRKAVSYMRFSVDENSLIVKLEYSTYDLESKLIEDDPAEYNDCINFICDQYSAEEWKQIMNSK